MGIKHHGLFISISLLVLHLTVGAGFIHHPHVRPGSFVDRANPHPANHVRQNGNQNGKAANTRVTGTALMMSSPDEIDIDEDAAKEELKMQLTKLADAAVEKDRAKAAAISREIYKSKAADKEVKETVRGLFETVPRPPPQPVAVWNDIQKATARDSFEESVIGLPEEEIKIRYEEPGEYELKQVWFATNREFVATEGEFANNLSDQTIFGSAYVKVPIYHMVGEMNRNWLQRQVDSAKGGLLSLKDWVMPPKKSLMTKELYTKKQPFLQDVAKYRDPNVPDTGTGEINALLYIHGFFNSFESAAEAIAQLGVDLKVSGPKVFFSWPSQNAFTSYFTDEENVAASRQQIKDFLVDFVKACAAENLKVHVIAHSMGNRALLNALEDIFNDASIKNEIELGQVIFAAPDVDQMHFKRQVHHVESAPILRKTLYTCHGDIALWGSAKVHGEGTRAGKYYPYTKAQKVDTIAVPAYVDMDFFGHGYYKDAKEMVTDMHALIHNNEHPDIRVGLGDACERNGKIAHGVWSVKK